MLHMHCDIDHQKTFCEVLLMILKMYELILKQVKYSQLPPDRKWLTQDLNLS